MLLFHPQFGGRLKTHHKEAYTRSKQWNGKEFDNLVETKMDISLKTLPGLLKAQFTNTKIREPEKPIPIIPFDEYVSDFDKAERNHWVKLLTWYFEKHALENARTLSLKNSSLAVWMTVFLVISNCIAKTTELNGLAIID